MTDKFKFNIQLFGESAGDQGDADLGNEENEDVEEEDLDEDDNDEDADEDGQDDEATAASSKKPQSDAENALAAAARRRAEAEFNAKGSKETARLNAMAKLYNHGSIQEMLDYEETQRISNLAEAQGKTVDQVKLEEAALADYQQRKDAEEAKAHHDQFLVDDAMAFKAIFPSVSIEKLENNPKFKTFAGERLYKVPIADLYAQFLDLTSEVSATKRSTANGVRSTGAGGGQGSPSGLTTHEKDTLESWNKRFPQYAMKAKEFKNSKNGG